jgi:hypothetical protein
MNDWQPIESAPKDGTEILLYIPGGDGVDETRTMDIGRWREWNAGHWLWLMNGGDGWGGCTHWQPLPAEPDSPTPTPPLSPAAQAVRDAYRKGGLDAALRAAADQVAPEEQEPVPNEDSAVEMQIWSAVAQRQRTRSQLLALVNELRQEGRA